MSTNQIIHHLEMGKLADAGEVLNNTLMNKIALALDEKRRTMGDSLVCDDCVNEEDDTAYEKFFRKALKKFGVSSPDEFNSDEEKKKFFNWIDKNYKGKHESVDLDEAAKLRKEIEGYNKKISEIDKK